MLNTVSVQSFIHVERPEKAAYLQVHHVNVRLIVKHHAGPDFAGGGPGANIINIHWSSGSTNWANKYDIYFRNIIVCMVFSTRVRLSQTLVHQHVATHDNRN